MGENGLEMLDIGNTMRSRRARNVSDKETSISGVPNDVQVEGV